MTAVTAVSTESNSFYKAGEHLIFKKMKTRNVLAPLIVKKDVIKCSEMQDITVVKEYFKV